MSFNTLTRNKDAVINALFETPSGELIAKEHLKIVIPVKYEESRLAVIEQDVYTLGIMAIIVGNDYACNMLPAKIRLTPTNIEKVTHDEESYYVLEFERGSTVTPNINVIKDETLGYYIYNYFIALGRAPWYMDALDFIKIFDAMGEYTGKTYGDNHVVTEMISSMVLRNPENNLEYWRQAIQTTSDIYNRKPEIVALRNVALGARNTTAKLMGSYFNEGLNSALLNPSDQSEPVEELLRQ